MTRLLFRLRSTRQHCVRTHSANVRLHNVDVLTLTLLDRIADRTAIAAAPLYQRLEPLSRSLCAFYMYKQTTDTALRWVTIKRKNKLMIMVNGGSASDSQHLSAELIGRFIKDRKPFPAIALTTDTSIITSTANDFSYDEIFSRQLLGIAKEGDVLIAISTSGESQSVINAVNTFYSLYGMVKGFISPKKMPKDFDMDKPIILKGGLYFGLK